MVISRVYSFAAGIRVGRTAPSVSYRHVRVRPAAVMSWLQGQRPAPGNRTKILVVAVHRRLAIRMPVTTTSTRPAIGTIHSKEPRPDVGGLSRIEVPYVASSDVKI